MILLAATIMFARQLVAQDSEAERLRIEIQQVESEIARYKQLLYGNRVIGQQCSRSAVVVQLKPMDREEFTQLCNYLSPDMEKLREKNPGLNCRINYSCSQKDGKNEISLYYEDFDCPASVNTPRDAGPGELEKIRNTRNMYLRLIGELDRELTFNSVEIVDQSSGLLLKHVPLGANQLKIIQEQAMQYLRESKNLNTSPINNLAADVVSGTVGYTEKVVELLPGGDKLTNHYLWKLFKSTPEAGKTLGHIGAYLDIYFRKNEYKKMVDELDQQEQLLMLK